MTKKFRLATLERKIKEGSIQCEKPKVGTVTITRTATGKSEVVEVFSKPNREQNGNKNEASVS